MPRPPILKRLLEGILSIGASPDESESRRSGRRVFMLAFILATLLTIPGVIERFDAGYTWVGVVDLVTTVIPVLLLVVIAVRPTSYDPCECLPRYCIAFPEFISALGDRTEMPFNSPHGVS